MPTNGISDPFSGVDFSELERSLRRPRTLVDFLLNVLVSAMTIGSLIPLFSVVLMLAWRGGQKLSLAVFTELPPAPLEPGGGFGNALIGTLVIVSLAVLITAPAGVRNGPLPPSKPLSRQLADNRWRV
jgi:phosphate transport system permease protein